MSTSDPDAVERRLRRLDAAACGALVADLWDARGFETRREGNVVVARRRGESRVIYPLPRRRIGSPPAPDRPVDVVVDPRAGSAAREVAAGSGARLVDAAGLRAMLRYGVDEGTAASLCERHLGARPSDLRPPLRTRIRERAASSAGTTALAGLVAVLLVGGLVVAGTPGLLADPGPGAGGSAATGGTAPTTSGADDRDAGDASTGTPTAQPSWPDGPGPVPGLDEDGIRDLLVLAAAHNREVRNRSYTLWIDYRGPDGPEANATRIHRDTDVRVDGRRYLSVTSVGSPGGDDREVTAVVYRDGRDRYVASSMAGNASYRLADGDGPPTESADPGTARRTLVRRYLSTPGTELNGTVSRDGRTHYRVVGRGRPAGLDRKGVRNYTVVALVGPEGLVRDMTATYTVDVARNVSVRREWTYGRVGETAVDPPAWYGNGEGTREGNATGTPAPGT